MLSLIAQIWVFPDHLIINKSPTTRVYPSADTARAATAAPDVDANPSVTRSDRGPDVDC